MAVFILVASIVGAFVVGGMLGYFTNHDINTFIKHENDTIKRENERLNAELKTLTDRDERGRFVGSKTK
jgi:hypothetical protein